MSASIGNWIFAGVRMSTLDPQQRQQWIGEVRKAIFRNPKWVRVVESMDTLSNVAGYLGLQNTWEIMRLIRDVRDELQNLPHGPIRSDAQAIADFVHGSKDGFGIPGADSMSMTLADLNMCITHPSWVEARLLYKYKPGRYERLSKFINSERFEGISNNQWHRAYVLILIIVEYAQQPDDEFNSIKNVVETATPVHYFNDEEVEVIMMDPWLF